MADQNQNPNPNPNTPSSSSSQNPSQNPYPQPLSHKFNPDGGGFASFSGPRRDDDDRYAVKMANFKAFLLQSAAFSSPTKSLSPSLKLLMEKRIQEFFPDFHTPDHPPYSAMITAAITTLNEDGGSSAEAISEFIQNNHTSLPRAHETFLKHSLQNLCGERLIAKAGDRFYILTRDEVAEPGARKSLMHPGNDDSGAGLCSSSSFSSWVSSDSRSSNSSSDSSDNSPTPISRRTRTYLGRKTKGPGAEAKQNADILASNGQKSTRGRGRKRKITTQGTRIYLDGAAKRRPRPGTARKEVQISTDVVMLEAEAEESEQQTDVKDGHRHRAVVECRDPVTGERRTVIDIDLDELLDMVNEEQDLLERSIEKVNNQADEEEHGLSLLKQDATPQQIGGNELGNMVLEENVRGNECEDEDFKVEIDQIGKPEMAARVNGSEEQHHLVMEGEAQVIGGTGTRDDEEQEHDSLMDKSLGTSEKLTNEVSEEAKKQIPEKEVERLTGSNRKQEDEEDENLVQEQSEAIVKISPICHDAEKTSDTEATLLPGVSFRPVFEEEKEDIPERNMEETTKTSKYPFFLQEPSLELEEEKEKNMEGQSDCPFLLQESSLELGEEKDKSEIAMEQKRDGPAEDENEGIYLGQERTTDTTILKLSNFLKVEITGNMT